MQNMFFTQRHLLVTVWISQSVSVLFTSFWFQIQETHRDRASYTTPIDNQEWGEEARGGGVQANLGNARILRACCRHPSLNITCFFQNPFSQRTEFNCWGFPDENESIILKICWWWVSCNWQEWDSRPVVNWIILQCTERVVPLSYYWRFQK